MSEDHYRNNSFEKSDDICKMKSKGSKVKQKQLKNVFRVSKSNFIADEYFETGKAKTSLKSVKDLRGGEHIENLL